MQAICSPSQGRNDADCDSQRHAERVRPPLQAVMPIPQSPASIVSMRCSIFILRGLSVCGYRPVRGVYSPGTRERGPITQVQAHPIGPPAPERSSGQAFEASLQSRQGDECQSLECRHAPGKQSCSIDVAVISSRSG